MYLTANQYNELRKKFSAVFIQWKYIKLTALEVQLDLVNTYLFLLKHVCATAELGNNNIFNEEKFSVQVKQK